jgi:hypothetical protein
MSKGQLLYRNVRARGLLDLFMVSAITGLLAVRFYLYMTGYPQIGNGTLHIAHMLWGGLLMMSALILVFAFIGMRVQRIAAIVGGIGFGVFIDELGKFITRDNDYFYRPTIGIIYAIFIGLYLLISFLTRAQRLSQRGYQLNALLQLEEAIEQNMDEGEKQRVHELLARAGQRSPITQHLQTFLAGVEAVPDDPPNRLRRSITYIDEHYRRFWQQRNSHRLVKTFFILEAALFLIGVLAAVFTNLDDISELLQGNPSYGTELLVGQFASSAVAAGYVLYGTYCFRSGRARAFEYFRRATLINLFLTEFFIFSRIGFEALPSFVFNLGLLGLITFALHQERRGHRAADF